MNIIMTDKTKKQRGRPRNASTHKSILKATAKLLKSTSVREVSIEAIARTAKVGKATIYRGWKGGKTDIILDVLLAAPELSAPLPVVKTHAQAAIAQLNKLLALLSSDNGTVLAQLMAEGTGDEKAAQALEDKLMKPLRSALEGSITQAQQSGEIPSGLAPYMAVSAICGAPIFQILTTGKTLNEEFCDKWSEVANQILSQGAIAPQGQLL